MAINAYTGLPGSGKSYQVVSYVILRALRQGRRVVTNVDGLKDDAIYEFLEKEGVHVDEMGEIVHVTDEDIAKPNFYYSEKDADNSIVQPGDLLIIDEAWRWFEDGNFGGLDLDDRALKKQVEKRIMNFFRYHRHYVDDNNVSCDITLVSQDVGDIGRKVKRVIETTTVMNKLVELGSSNKFRIEVYSKTDVRKRPINTGFGVYKKKYFDLYESYSFKNKEETHGIEKKVDNRSSVWSNPFIRYVFFPALALFPVCIWLIIDLVGNFSTFGMNDEQKAAFLEQQKQLELERSHQSKKVDNSDNFGTGFPPELEAELAARRAAATQRQAQQNPPSPVQVSNQDLDPEQLKESSSYTLSGHFRVDGRLYIRVSTGSKQRIIDGSDFQIIDGILQGEFNNEVINVYTGGAGISLQPSITDDIELPDPSRIAEDTGKIITAG